MTDSRGRVWFLRRDFNRSWASFSTLLAGEYSTSMTTGERPLLVIEMFGCLPGFLARTFVLSVSILEKLGNISARRLPNSMLRACSDWLDILNSWGLKNRVFLQEKMEPMIGFEPMTDGLRNRCSTAELHWRGKFQRRREVLGQAGKRGGLRVYCGGLRGVVVVLMWRKCSQVWVTGRW